MFAWASLTTVELAIGDLRRTAAIEASFAGTDAFTGLVEQAITGLMDVASAMTDPGKAARALLYQPAVRCRATGDYIRFQLVAATLLFRAGDLREAESTSTTR